MEYPLGWCGLAVLVVSPPKSLPSPSLLGHRVGKRRGLDDEQFTTNYSRMCYPRYFLTDPNTATTWLLCRGLTPSQPDPGHPQKSGVKFQITTLFGRSPDSISLFMVFIPMYVFLPLTLREVITLSDWYVLLDIVKIFKSSL